MANEKQLNAPNLDTLVNAGSNAAQTAAKPNAESKPETIDLSSVGGVLIASPHTAGSEPVDLSSLYGERGGRLQRRSPVEPSDEE